MGGFFVARAHLQLRKSADVLSGSIPGLLACGACLRIRINRHVSKGCYSNLPIAPASHQLRASSAYSDRNLRIRISSVLTAVLPFTLISSGDGSTGL